LKKLVSEKQKMLQVVFTLLSATPASGAEPFKDCLHPEQNCTGVGNVYGECVCSKKIAEVHVQMLGGTSCPHIDLVRNLPNVQKYPMDTCFSADKGEAGILSCAEDGSGGLEFRKFDDLECLLAPSTQEVVMFDDSCTKNVRPDGSYVWTRVLWANRLVVCPPPTALPTTSPTAPSRAPSRSPTELPTTSKPSLAPTSAPNGLGDEEPSKPAEGVNRGFVIGAAVGGGAGLLILGCLVWKLMIGRRVDRRAFYKHDCEESSESDVTESDFTIDESRI